VPGALSRQARRRVLVELENPSRQYTTLGTAPEHIKEKCHGFQGVKQGGFYGSKCRTQGEGEVRGYDPPDVTIRPLMPGDIEGLASYQSPDLVRKGGRVTI